MKLITAILLCLSLATLPVGGVIVINSFMVRSGTLLTGLESYWKLDEASGTRVDAHGSNDLTDNNTVTSATGKINDAGQFVAANSEYLSHVDNSSLSTGDIDFTFTAWVYLDSKPAYSLAIAQSNASAYGPRLWHYNTSDRFVFDVGDGATTIVGTVSADTLGAPSIGTWYFIAAWHNAAANTVNIQVNNGTVDSASTTGVLADSAAIMCLGRQDYAPYDGFFDGRIDEVGFWKRVLTADERTALYNSGSGLPYSSF